MSRRCLIIGCSQFEDVNFNELTSVPSDVDTLFNILSNPALGNFDSVDIIYNSTKEFVHKRIEVFLLSLFGNDEGMIYILSHGQVPRQNQLIICFQNTKKDLLRSTGLKFSEILFDIHDLLSSKLLIILDLCFAGVGINIAENYYLQNSVNFINFII